MVGLKVLKDYTGLVIGKVTVLHRSRNTKVTTVQTGKEHRPTLAWTCQCACGNVWDVPHSRISTASPATCNDCADRTHKQKLPSSKEHIKKKHPSYNSWYSMIRRCTSPKHMHYKYYGAKGITVPPQWLDFDQFVRDMGERPEGTTIDRKDNTKSYSKDNCRWATPTEQANNTSRSPKYKPKPK